MKLIILDRDGVINQEREDFIKNPDEWVAFPESLEAIANLTQSGFKVVICTNQSGLGRGLYTIETLNNIHEKMLKVIEQAGGEITAIFFCPHKPNENCDCRKPKPGMIKEIFERFSIDNPETIMFVGDSLRDLEAIHDVGGIPVLVKTGNGKKTLAKGGIPKNTLIFDNLLAVSEYLINKDNKE